MKGIEGGLGFCFLNDLIFRAGHAKIQFSRDKETKFSGHKVVCCCNITIHIWCGNSI